ncbi:unnamed protein product [Knipowitschia caucasica]
MAKRSTESSESEEFNEPDLEFSSEWLPFEFVSSRESPPDAHGYTPSRSRSASTSSSDSGSVTLTHKRVKKRKKGAAAKSNDGDWRKADWSPNVFPFTATPGPQNAAAELDSDLPADFLELFITDELLQLIARQTNLHAQQYFQAHPNILPHSRGHTWKPVTIPELKTFFGLTFVTSYVKKPSLGMYWSVDEIDATPFFSQTMSRNRFQIIWRFLHYNDNSSIDDMDKMYEVRPVLDYLVQKFKDLFQPGQNICIDECMMQWRGKLSFTVYNPHTPVKYGIKSYVLCDSATGYCFNLQPHVGDSRALPDIVFSLLDRLTSSGHTLFMDHFYNSIALCEQLLEAKTNVCGSLRDNRGEPRMIREVKKSALGAGGRVVCNNKKVMVVAWQDKKLVKMVTTCHQDDMKSVDVWKSGHREKVTLMKPACVVAYKASMNGVDHFVKNEAYNPSFHKSLNWSKKYVAYLFQITMFNAYILYRARNKECKTLLEFMRRVAKSWTAKQCVVEEEDQGNKKEQGNIVQEEGHSDKDTRVKVEPPSKEQAPLEDESCLEEGAHRIPRAPYNTDPESRLDGNMARHKLEYLLSSVSSKARPSRRCRVCTRKGLRRDTRMWCKSCCVPLHAGECFNVYHSKKDYTV